MGCCDNLWPRKEALLLVLLCIVFGLDLVLSDASPSGSSLSDWIQIGRAGTFGRVAGVLELNELVGWAADERLCGVCRLLAWDFGRLGLYVEVLVFLMTELLLLNAAAAALRSSSTSFSASLIHLMIFVVSSLRVPSYFAKKRR
jgi:hypothetical protein